MAKNELKCKDCCYQWQEEWEFWPHCHWESRCPGDKAPCEYDDDDYYGDDGDEDYCPEEEYFG